MADSTAARGLPGSVRVGAIPTVIVEGVDGLLIAHRNVRDLIAQLRRLIDQPEMRHSLGETGYHKVVRRYTWHHVADRFREVYAPVQHQ